MYDIEEGFTPKDINGDGEPDKLLYLIGDKPNNLIVDWIDQDNPQVLLEIGLGDGITSRWGEQFENIIEEIDFTDVKQQYVEDVDSLVTLFTREKVGHVISNVSLLTIIMLPNQSGRKQLVEKQNVFTIIIFFTTQNTLIRFLTPLIFFLVFISVLMR